MLDLDNDRVLIESREMVMMAERDALRSKVSTLEQGLEDTHPTNT